MSVKLQRGSRFEPQCASDRTLLPRGADENSTERLPVLDARAVRCTARGMRANGEWLRPWRAGAFASCSSPRAPGSSSTEREREGKSKREVCVREKLLSTIKQQHLDTGGAGTVVEETCRGKDGV
ncbi:hypothetical protein AOLI_G00302960 [Acnodon oligacanthus]